VAEDVVESSSLIETPAQAAAYFKAHLAGAHKITCHGRPTTIVFHHDGTHLYSVAAEDPIPVDLIVDRPIARGRVDRRKFSITRARLMDEVLPAISQYTVSIPGKGHGDRNRLLHGQRLPSGDYLRVVIDSGPGTAWTCLTAFPVSVEEWRRAQAARRAKFPS
jgi:hypothetical protein